MKARTALAALLIALCPTLAHAQGAIQQLGPVVVGHLPMWASNGHLMDAGGSPGLGMQPANNANSGTLPTGLGVINSGLGFCDYTGYSSTAYNQFCWGFDGSGNGLVNLNRIGGGSALTLNFNINGSISQYPGNGQGNVLGPVSSTINEPVVWNNTTGTLVKDGLNVPIVHTGDFAVYANGSGAVPGSSAFIFSAQESYTAGSAFYDPFFVQNVMLSGGTGHRQAGTFEMSTGFGAVGKNYVGLQAFGHLTSGSSGSVFGTNPYAWVDDGVIAGTEVVGEEINTDVRATTNVVRKVGLQIIDVATSTGGATVANYGMLIDIQAGAEGYHNAIQIGQSSASPIASGAGGAILNTSAFTADYGIYLGFMTCTIDCFNSNGFRVNGSGDIFTTANLTVGGTIGTSPCCTGTTANTYMRNLGTPTYELLVESTGNTITSAFVGDGVQEVMAIKTTAEPNPNNTVFKVLDHNGATQIGVTQAGVFYNPKMPVGGANPVCVDATGFLEKCTTLTAGASTLASAAVTGAATVGTTLGVSGLASVGTFKVTQASPAAADACTAGQIVADTGFIYACTASGAWKRVAVTGGY